MRRFIGIFGVLILWEVFARLIQSPVIIPLDRIVLAAISLISSGELAQHILVSLQRITIGFLIAAISGIGLGTTIYLYKSIDQIFTPVVDVMRPIAALTIFPVIILTMGIGLSSKVFVIFWTAWPACLLNTVQALRDVDTQIVEAASLDGASRFQTLRYIQFPVAAPLVITGLRIGLSGGWIAVVTSEMIGANSGLGFSVLATSNTFRFPEMYTYIFTIAFLGLLMNVALNGLQTLFDYKGENHVQKSKYLSFNDRSIMYPFDSVPARKRASR